MKDIDIIEIFNQVNEPTKDMYIIECNNKVEEQMKYMDRIRKG